MHPVEPCTPSAAVGSERVHVRDGTLHMPTCAALVH